MAIFIDLKVAKNGNKWLQIIAKIGNKMVTLSLYRNLSPIFAIFGNILLQFQKLLKMAIFIDLKVAKNGK